MPTLRPVRQVKTLADEIGVSFMGLGFQPRWAVHDTPAMPKARPGFARARAAPVPPGTQPELSQGRYKLMREYMPKVGTMGLDSASSLGSPPPLRTPTAEVRVSPQTTPMPLPPAPQ